MVLKKLIGGFRRKAPPASPVAPPPPPPAPVRPNRPEGMALALQGGGSLGAFTWGVLDRLLEEPGFSPVRLSGASAGAVNAAAFACGWAADGPAGARATLDLVWQKVGECGAGSLGFCPSWPASGVVRAVNAAALQMATRFFSPYALNPLGINPLRDILAEVLDFQALKQKTAPRLYISATRVRDGSPRVFTNGDISLEALLASTTLPAIHQAVEIEGEAYWDGGYTLNPPVAALLEGPAVGRILVVQAMPNRASQTPKTADAIRERLNEITFSRPLEAEIALVREKLAHRDRPESLHLLAIDPDSKAVEELDGLRVDQEYLAALKVQGRKQATIWLQG
ncbi:patatin-like phospholipase family protein [Niveispirillum sp. BGYR6]|uniref:patatin-like phospholipase family protein n=1 Tax=Niveispirillum sp. BGYR6 TaxID=2971249 RepID=UPI0022B97D68|nr:patatin-like phospholipase family protein [Niveispirillum sp. BGYR6]MDG5494761.1 patatin-like phospholipase family protein [Niveispirillum sp. BGYR6]